MYIFKKDRAIIKSIEECINSVLGVDKDVYMDDRYITKRTRIARYAWVYWVYKNTILNHENIAEMIGRNQSNVSRAIANVEMWLKNKSRKENYYITQIQNEIKQKIKQTDARKNQHDY